MMLAEADWDVRRYIYDIFAGAGKLPEAQDIAQQFGTTVIDAIASLRRLHLAHALFLRPGSDEILMANPLSAVATDYGVEVRTSLLHANCAWDSLGIPAMLKRDSKIAARHPLGNETIGYAVKSGKLIGNPSLCVHFAKPFRNWYDDIVDT